jgi:hypothetical protein
MGAADTMPSLPEDAAALRALLLATLEQRDAAMAERDALAVRNEQLHHLLLKLKRRQFGQKSERLCGTGSLTWPRAAPRQSRRRRCGGLPPSTLSRRRSAATLPWNA